MGHHKARAYGYTASRLACQALEALVNDGQPMTPDKALAVDRLTTAFERIRKGLERPWLRKSRRPKAKAKVSRPKTGPSLATITELGEPGEPCTVPEPGNENTEGQADSGKPVGG